MNNVYIKEMIKNFAPLLLVTYCFLGVFPLLKYTYMNHEPFLISFKYVGPAMLASIFYLTFSAIRSKNLFFKVIYLVQILIKAFFITIMTTGYLLLVNDYFSDSKEVCFNGELIEKWKNSESILFTDYNFKIIDRGSSKQYSLNVNRNDFEKYQEGQLFKQCLKEGALGIHFR
jgi:hypothetical protein